MNDGDNVEDVAKEVEDDEDEDEDDEDEDDEDEEDEEEEEVEQTYREAGDRVKDRELEASKPLQMMGVELLKDADPTSASSKSRSEVSQISVEV